MKLTQNDRTLAGVGDNTTHENIPSVLGGGYNLNINSQYSKKYY
jgi:hypothetical protein